MTTILVATDFSVNAHWATDYALELANQLGGRLILLHAYDPFPKPTLLPAWKALLAEGQYDQAIFRLNQVRNQLLQATNKPVDIAVVARPGSPARCLHDEAASQKADLLVMGLVGDEPLKARQLGSLATDMIASTQVPMLLVPPGVVYHKPHRIVLAIDLANPVNAPALSHAKGFAQLLHATLDLIYLADEPDETLQKAAHAVCDSLSDQPHTFRFLPGYDLAIVLEEYLLDHQADLIMLLPRPHSRLRTFLLESDTQEVARLATVPVLAAV